MLNLLEWKVLLRQGGQAPGAALPAAILTAQPGFRQDDFPAEVGLLLPNGIGARGLIAALAGDTRPPAEGGAGTPPGGASAAPGKRALGLFLADPFLHVPIELAALRAAGAGWIANLPSVGQQDGEFLQQLGDVGLDVGLELERLARLKAEGFGILAVACGAEPVPGIVALDPAAILVLPRVADFAAGFPSFRQRGTAVREVAEAARAAGWRGPVLGLAAAGELAHETLWPDALDGVLARPRAVSISPASPAGRT